MRSLSRPLVMMRCCGGVGAAQESSLKFNRGGVLPTAVLCTACVLGRFLGCQERRVHGWPPIHWLPAVQQNLELILPTTRILRSGILGRVNL